MVKRALLLPLLASAALAAPGPPTPPAAEPGLVWIARDPDAVRDGRVQSGSVRRMVDALVLRATGQSDVASAWRTLVAPGDRVGLKVSAAGAPVSSTHPAVVAAVADGLVAAGVAPDRIVIWDREWQAMARAGYGGLSRRHRVIATDLAGGYAEKEFVTAAVMGKLIVGDREFKPRAGSADQTSSRSHISNVLAGWVDKVVHIPALTDHFASGLNGAVSGMVLDNLDNWRRLARPPHFGDPYLPEAYADPRLGGKVVLTVVDALRPQYAGGPFPGAEYIASYGAILVSRDPVAADAIGVGILERFRAEAGMPPLAPMTRWLESAEVHGLGIADRSRLRLVAVPAP